MRMRPPFYPLPHARAHTHTQTHTHTCTHAHTHTHLTSNICQPASESASRTPRVPSPVRTRQLAHTRFCTYPHTHLACTRVCMQLCAGAREADRSKWHLGKASDYILLNQSGCYQLASVDDAHEYLVGAGLPGGAHQQGPGFGWRDAQVLVLASR